MFILPCQVWPFLLGVYDVMSTPTQRTLIQTALQEHYESVLQAWVAAENAMKVYRADEMLQCEELFGEMSCREDQLEAQWRYREKSRQLRSGSVSPSAASDRTVEGRQKQESCSPGTPQKQEEAAGGEDVQNVTDKAKSSLAGGKSDRSSRTPVSARKAKLRPSQVDSSDDKSAAVLPVNSGDAPVADTAPQTCPGCLLPVDAEATSLSVSPETFNADHSPQGSNVVHHSLCPVCGKQRQHGQSGGSSTAAGGQDTPSEGLAACALEESTTAEEKSTASEKTLDLPDAAEFTVSQRVCEECAFAGQVLGDP